MKIRRNYQVGDIVIDAFPSRQEFPDIGIITKVELYSKKKDIYWVYWFDGTYFDHAGDLFTKII